LVAFLAYFGGCYAGWELSMIKFGERSSKYSGGLTVDSRIEIAKLFASMINKEKGYYQASIIFRIGDDGGIARIDEVLIKRN
jgi:hypothetical protein